MKHQSRLRRFKTQKKKKVFKLSIKFLVIVALILVSLFYFLTRTKYWDGKNKLSVAMDSGNEVQVVTFDPNLDQITTIMIPVNTQVDVARDLGKWKLGSVWKLGQSEKVGGVLLQETIVKNFGFPLTAWADKNGLGLSTGNLSNIVPSVFSLYKTNLTTGDKLHLFLFALKLNSANKNTIDLTDTQILRKIKLVDGEAGFAIMNSTPTEFIGLFSDRHISNGLFTVSLTDFSEENNLSDNISTTLEYLGAKVVSKTSGGAQDLDCEVYSKDKKMGTLVSQIFNCKFLNQSPEGNFDLELRFGKGFAKRF